MFDFSYFFLSDVGEVTFKYVDVYYLVMVFCLVRILVLFGLRLWAVWSLLMCLRALLKVCVRCSLFLLGRRVFIFLCVLVYVVVSYLFSEFHFGNYCLYVSSCFVIFSYVALRV